MREYEIQMYAPFEKEEFLPLTIVGILVLGPVLVGKILDSLGVENALDTGILVGVSFFLLSTIVVACLIAGTRIALSVLGAFFTFLWILLR